MKVDSVERDAIRAEESASGVRLPAGTRLGDHLLLMGVLGEGSSATVYEAINTKLEAPVAVKVLMSGTDPRDNARARLLNEARICAGIEDPHVPRIYDVGQLPDGTPYTVMEKLAGRSLESMLLAGPLPFATALQVMEHLLCALEGVHAAGVVHRDVKPGNIMVQVDRSGAIRLRLMDFGICTSLQEQDGLRSDPRLTQAGLILGTPHYMPPEQIAAGAVDGRADLFAAAAVFVELLQGKPPFRGETIPEVFAAILDPRPLSEREPLDVPAPLRAVIDRALHVDRAARFASARELREAIAGATQKPSSATGVRGVTRVEPAMRGSALRRDVLLGALVVLGVFFLSRWLVAKPSNDLAQALAPPESTQSAVLAPEPAVVPPDAGVSTPSPEISESKALAGSVRAAGSTQQAPEPRARPVVKPRALEVNELPPNPY